MTEHEKGSVSTRYFDPNNNPLNKRLSKLFHINKFDWLVIHAKDIEIGEKLVRGVPEKERIAATLKLDFERGNDSVLLTQKVPTAFGQRLCVEDIPVPEAVKKAFVQFLIDNHMDDVQRNFSSQEEDKVIAFTKELLSKHNLLVRPDCSNQPMMR